MLKPKAQTESEDGMLEFLEDIIGSSQYKEPIEELSKRVEELNEARGEKVYILYLSKSSLLMTKHLLFNWPFCLYCLYLTLNSVTCQCCCS